MKLQREPAVAMQPPRARGRHRPAAIAGASYVISWAIGLLIFTASTSVRVSGADLLRGYAGHELAAAAQCALTEGAPAIALAVVVCALARAAHAASELRLEQAVLVTGLGAALVSLWQCLLGLYLNWRLIPESRAHAAVTVNNLVIRFDGVKMFLLCGLAIAGFAVVRRGRVALPQWLASVALALAASLALSGIGYLFLLDGPATAAWVSLPLLLAWICGLGAGLTLDRGWTSEPTPEPCAA